jgi:hypothetical protein
VGKAERGGRRSGSLKCVVVTFLDGKENSLLGLDLKRTGSRTLPCVLVSQSLALFLLPS